MMANQENYQFVHNINKNYISTNCNDARLRREKEILTKVMSKFVADIRQKSPLIDRLFQGIYYTGSTYDGLQVESATNNDFDVNILFKLSQPLKVGEFCHPTLRNFTSLTMEVADYKQLSSDEQELFNINGKPTLSPTKLFRCLQTVCDQVIASYERGLLPIQGMDVYISREIGSPFILKARVPIEGTQISIDICPAIPFKSVTMLPNNSSINDRIKDIMWRLTIPDCGFMAIVLMKADPHFFEIDFHDFERAILKDKGCVKSIIRLLKFFRNEQKIKKCWSHMLKNIVMHMVVDFYPTQADWNEKFILTRFIEALRAWREYLTSGQLEDVFYEEVNLMSRLHPPQYRNDVANQIGRLLEDYGRNNDIRVFFPDSKLPKVRSSVGAVSSQPISKTETSLDRKLKTDNANSATWLLGSAAVLGVAAAVCGAVSLIRAKQATPRK